MPTAFGLNLEGKAIKLRRIIPKGDLGQSKCDRESSPSD
jgi:hypothetical protein